MTSVSFSAAAVLHLYGSGPSFAPSATSQLLQACIEHSSQLGAASLEQCIPQSEDAAPFIALVDGAGLVASVPALLANATAELAAQKSTRALYSVGLLVNAI